MFGGIEQTKNAPSFLERKHAKTGNHRLGSDTAPRPTLFRAAEQQHTRGDGDHQVAHARAVTALAVARLHHAALPDEEHRAQRGELPEDEERDEVAGEGRRDCGARVDTRGEVLHPALHLPRVDAAAGT